MEVVELTEPEVNYENISPDIKNIMNYENISPDIKNISFKHLNLSLKFNSTVILMH